MIFVVVPVRTGDPVSYPPRLPVCCQTPADLAFAYEDVSFPTADGLTLRGWYLPGHNGATILLAHGGGGNRLGVGQLEQAAGLAGRGFGMLLFNLRGHGESDGA